VLRSPALVQVSRRRNTSQVVFYATHSAGVSVLLLVSVAAGADLQATADLLRTGHYEACARQAEQAIAEGEYGEAWRLLKIEAEMATGDYGAALDTLDTALRRYYGSVRLRWLGSRLCRQAGLVPRADGLLAEIEVLVQRSPWNYGDAANRVALGQCYLSRGVDARQVLELFFDRAKEIQPKYIEAYLSAAELALDKHDFQLAAQELQKALEQDDGDPRIHLGLARAYAPSDSARADAALQQALTLNPRHVPSLLFAAEEQLDAQRYDEAEALLARALQVNAECPEAWAFRAVIAHLRADPTQEGFCRRVALGWWPLNPRVDWLIGRKLSQNYRFAEGVVHQRRALLMDPRYLPARFQLAQDLLRLGEEQEGWQLLAEVVEADGYNVVAMNLARLDQRLRSFRTLEADGILLRMDAREAEIYGQRALELLQEARNTLCRKYGHTPSEPVIVELFPEQQDFAIRTFGLPGGEGFLGVCFGRVITANSPAAHGHTKSNWESVLWHEFCHVVTLQKTGNRMPRWLSEGISVYEERQKNAAWGQRMNPEYRQRILEGKLTPVSRLSTAFLRPESPQDLQFAYFEASLVVEFLIEQFGLDALLRTLQELELGLLLEDALPRHTAPLDVLDHDFTEFARRKAAAFAKDVDWMRPDARTLQDSTALEAWLAAHPDTYFARYRRAERLIREQQWDEARELLEALIAGCPDYVGGESGYALLIEVCRRAQDTQGEQRALAQWAVYDAENVDGFQRLAELSRAAGDWPTVMASVDRALAVNPLRPAVQRLRAEAARQTDRPDEAVQAYRALLQLDPVDPADLHFQLASLLLRQGDRGAARRHVLQSLEEAPRYAAAQELLLQIVEQDAPAGSNDSAEPHNSETKP
jgi:tetratricopeptide (TPR) repeat protein